MRAQVFLYSTLGCHLCDQAKAIIWPLLSHYPYALTEVDIASNDELMELYGIHIPVLYSAGQPEPLRWPFDSQQVEQFFAALAST